jgi:hypothetical protein
MSAWDREDSPVGGGADPLAALQAQALVQNESTGGSGAPISSGITGSVVLFQDNWTSTVANRGGGAGTVIRNGVNSPYSLGAYMDPNDGFKTKLLVVDRNNNRVLIFNSIPNDSFDNPDVVVGQANFTTGTAHGGLGSVNAAGFNAPTHVTVCADGKMFVSDSSNHRVLGYNQIPTTDGASADFVIGQPSFTVGTANNGVGVGGITQAQRLAAPYATHCVGGKLLVVDRNNRRILVYNTIPSQGEPLNAPVTADLAIGQPDLTTVALGACNYSTSASYLNTPYELGVHSGGLYIADGGNHRILVYNAIPTAADARPNYVVGQPTSSSCGINAGGGDANPTQGSFHFPNSLAFKDGYLAVGDHSNQRLMFFALPITADGALAAHQLGRPNYTTAMPDPPAAADGTFGSIKGLLFDDDHIWVTDGVFSRAQRVALPY